MMQGDRRTRSRLSRHASHELACRSGRERIRELLEQARREQREAVLIAANGDTVRAVIVEVGDHELRAYAQGSHMTWHPHQIHDVRLLGAPSELTLREVRSKEARR